MSTFNGYDIVERWFAVCGDDYNGPCDSAGSAEIWANLNPACDKESGKFNGYKVEKAWVILCKGKFRKGPFKAEKLAIKAASRLIECGEADPSYEYPEPGTVVNGKLDKGSPKIRPGM